MHVPTSHILYKPDLPLLILGGGGGVGDQSVSGLFLPRALRVANDGRPPTLCQHRWLRSLYRSLDHVCKQASVSSGSVCVPGARGFVFAVLEWRGVAVTHWHQSLLPASPTMCITSMRHSVRTQIPVTGQEITAMNLVVSVPRARP